LKSAAFSSTVEATSDRIEAVNDTRPARLLILSFEPRMEMPNFVGVETTEMPAPASPTREADLWLPP